LIWLYIKRYFPIPKESNIMRWVIKPQQTLITTIEWKQYLYEHQYWLHENSINYI